MLLRWILAVSLLLCSFAFAVIAWNASQPAAVAGPAPAATPEAPPARVAVLAARGPIRPGTLLKDTDVAVRELTPDQVPPDAFLNDDTGRAELTGALVRRYLGPNEVLQRGDVLRPRERGFLAAVLRPSMRAISIGVDAVTGTAGLIWPGDQVDLILTQELDASSAPISRRVVGETVLSNVRVIAVDQELSQGGGGGALLGGARGIARTVTLEVTNNQAERIAVAERLGRLSLAVRPIDADTPQGGAGGGAVFGADVSPALLRNISPAGARIRVFHGGELNEVTFR